MKFYFILLSFFSPSLLYWVFLIYISQVIPFPVPMLFYAFKLNIVAPFHLQVLSFPHYSSQISSLFFPIEYCYICSYTYNLVSPFMLFMGMALGLTTFIEHPIRGFIPGDTKLSHPQQSTAISSFLPNDISLFYITCLLTTGIVSLLFVQPWLREMVL